jgi:diacylglycerol kinase family enzyme
MNPLTVAILNAASGPAGEEAAKRLREILRSRGLDWKVCTAQKSGDLADLARAAAESDARVIVASGGDGTLSAVASRLAGSGKALGVLPVGTFNHFAKDLGIPLDLEAAVENIAAGRVVSIDVAEINGRVFLNNSSIGLYPKMVLRREAQRKVGRPKWLAVSSALYRTLREYTVLHVRITADGRRLRRRTPILFVGNNEYQIEGRDLGGRRRLDRGVLCLYVLHNRGVWGLVKFLLRALCRRAWRIRDFDALQAREIRVEIRRKRLRVAVDGELADCQPPLDYRIRSGALRVIVPESLPEP